MSADVVSIITLSTLAGLSTGLGGLVVLIRKPGEKLLVFLMGLAAGIMIMLSFLGLLFESLKRSRLFLASFRLALISGLVEPFRRCDCRSISHRIPSTKPIWTSLCSRSNGVHHLGRANSSGTRARARAFYIFRRNNRLYLDIWIAGGYFIEAAPSAILSMIQSVTSNSARESARALHGGLYYHLERALTPMLHYLDNRLIF